MEDNRSSASAVVVVDPDCVPEGGSERFVRELRRGAGDLRLDWLDTAELGELSDPDADGPAAPAVVACGGAAIIRACMTAVAGTATALAIVPLQRDLAVASELGARDDGETAPGAMLTAALDAPLRRIDLGDVNGEVFATATGFGAAAVVPGPAARRRSVLGVVRALRRLIGQTSSVTVHVDGVQRWSGRTPVVLVGNGRRVVSGGRRLEVFPDADVADGELDVAVLAPSNPIQWIVTYARLLIGDPPPTDAFVRTRGDWIHVRSDVPRPYEIDGERRTAVPHLDVRVWPGALLLHAHPVPDPPVLDSTTTAVHAGDAELVDSAPPAAPVPVDPGLIGDGPAGGAATRTAWPGPASGPGSAARSDESASERSASDRQATDAPDAPDARGAPDPTGPDAPDPGESGARPTGHRWVPAVDDGRCDGSHPVKANERSGIYHEPGGRFYDRTRAQRCYECAEHARADGFRPSRS